MIVGKKDSQRPGFILQNHIAAACLTHALTEMIADPDADISIAQAEGSEEGTFGDPKEKYLDLDGTGEKNPT